MPPQDEEREDIWERLEVGINELKAKSRCGSGQGCGSAFLAQDECPTIELDMASSIFWYYKTGVSCVSERTI